MDEVTGRVVVRPTHDVDDWCPPSILDGATVTRFSRLFPRYFVAGQRRHWRRHQLRGTGARVPWSSSMYTNLPTSIYIICPFSSTVVVNTTYFPVVATDLQSLWYT